MRKIKKGDVIYCRSSGALFIEENNSLIVIHDDGYQDDWSSISGLELEPCCEILLNIMDIKPTNKPRKNVKGLGNEKISR